MRLSSYLLFAATLIAPVLAPAQPLPRTASPAGAEVYIIAPVDAAVVSKEFTVRFGLKGMGVAPAGTVAPNAGHHHLLIDSALPALDQAIPADAQHLHFGKGQTEATITLAPGKHTLQLLLGDQNHTPHEPAVASAPITITVE